MATQLASLLKAIAAPPVSRLPPDGKIFSAPPTSSVFHGNIAKLSRSNTILAFLLGCGRSLVVPVLATMRSVDCSYTRYPAACVCLVQAIPAVQISQVIISFLCFANRPLKPVNICQATNRPKKWPHHERFHKT